MPAIRSTLAAALLAGLAACTVARPQPGTPEFAAERVSRAYECGLRVERSRIAARLAQEDRQRFVSAGQGYAVKSYKAPKPCDAAERSRLGEDLTALARR